MPPYSLGFIMKSLRISCQLFLYHTTGTVAGSFDDFAIQSEIKKGERTLTDKKDGGEKTMKVESNNGDVEIEFGGE